MAIFKSQLGALVLLLIDLLAITSCAPIPSTEANGILAIEPVWLYKTNERVVSSPVISQDAIYIRTKDSLIALRLADGSLKWQTETSGRATSEGTPQIFNDLIFVPEGGGALGVFHIDIGTLAWRDCLKNVSTGKCAERNGVATIESMAFSQQEVAVSRADHPLTVYDIQTGKILWTRETLGRTYNPVVASEDVFYFVNAGDNSLEAYQSYNGALLWAVGLEGGRIVLDSLKETIYAVANVSPETQIWAIDIKTDQIRWKQTVPSEDATIYTYLAVNDDTLFVSNNRLLALSTENGKILWKTDDIHGLQKPIVHSKIILVRSIEGKLYAFSRMTGELLGSMPLDNQVEDPVWEFDPASDDKFVAIPIGRDKVAVYKIENTGSEE